MFKIGYIKSGYPEVRCVINRGGQNWTYQRIGKIREFLIKSRRVVNILTRRFFRKPAKSDWDLHAVYRPFFNPKVDVIHTFNAVCRTKKPWVSTFETIIPRTETTCNLGLPNLNRVTIDGFQSLLEDSCLGAIALSEATKKIQLIAMDYLNIPNRDKIAEKILVCHPPQPVLINENELKDKYSSFPSRIELLFVGRLFFRKGGAEVVDVLSELIQQYPNIHLTIVSKLTYGDNVSRTVKHDQEKYLNLFHSSEWITYYDELPNTEVLKLCKKAHIGLLPTFADTYGYSVLEMQACGCPVITTDIRALPEINDDRCGYLINVPKHPSTEAKYDTEEELADLKKAVYTGLKKVLCDILENPDVLRMKSRASLERIKKNHSPEEYAQFLSDIYSRGLKNKSIS